MKRLESNLIGVNVAILPVGKQHDTAYEISERVGYTHMKVGRTSEMLEILSFYTCVLKTTII